MAGQELYNFTWQARDDGGSRVFIQGPSDACPIGCAYCYIGDKGVEPEPYDRARLGETIDTIIEHPNFTDDTMVSLGCDTDPLLPQLLEGTMQIIGRFSELPNSIQLASKLVIPEELIDFSRNWPLGKRPPVLSTSITSIRFADRVEPRAPSPEERASNFDRISQMRWNSLALMKPVLASMIGEKDAFVDLYKRHSPDGIVVGDMYRRGLGNGRPQPHPIARDWTLRPQEDYKRNIINYLQESLPHIFVMDSSVDAAIRLIQG